METSLSGDIKEATTWSIVLSVLMIAVAILALFAPAMTGVAVTLLFGWLLIISGILHLGFAWRAASAGGVFWEILVAILYGAIGYYLLTRPILGLEALTFALAIYLVFEGALEFVQAFALWALPGSGWLLFDGIVTVLLAVLIGNSWPASSTWVIGTLVAISMFFSGLTRLMLSLGVRRAVA
jgi:uncharacterized membrane protein HdeD (DUF308 family)